MNQQSIKQSNLFIGFGLLILTGVIILLPIDRILNGIIESNFKIEYIGLLLKMSVIFLISYISINKLKLSHLAGLSAQWPWQHKSLNLIPIYLFVIGILSFFTIDSSPISAFNVIILFVACLMVGFAEEYLFRGVIQSLLLRRYASQSKGVFLSIALSSLLFGAFHLLNLFKSDVPGQVLVQVVFATFIGFFFGALLLKTNKLVPIAITHGLINFFFSLSILPGVIKPEEEAARAVSLAPIILFLPLFIIGVLIYRRLNKDEILQKVNA